MTSDALRAEYYQRHGSNINLYLYGHAYGDETRSIFDSYVKDWNDGSSYLSLFGLGEPRAEDTAEELTAWAKMLHSELCQLAVKAYVATLTPDAVAILLTALDDGFGTCVMLAGVHPVSADAIANAYNNLHPERPVRRALID